MIVKMMPTEKAKNKKISPERSEWSLLHILIARNPERAEKIIRKIYCDKRERKVLAKTHSMS